MNLNQLRCFVELARCEHLTNTATQLNYSVPALSNIISSLEEELGIKLFDRVGRNIKLNDNGALFYQYINESLYFLDKGILEVKEKNRRISKTISIATVDRTFWLKPLNMYIKGNPSVVISRIGIDIFALQNSSALNKYDFILCAEDDFKDKDWESVNLLSTCPIILLSRDHPMTGKSEVTMKELAGEHFMVMQKGNSMRKYFEDVCTHEHVTIPNTTECDAMMRNITLRQGFQCVALSTSYAYSCMNLDDINFVKLKTDYPTRYMTLYWNKNKKLSEEAEKFKEFFIDYYKDYQFLNE